MFTAEQNSALAAPLDRKHVASRTQAGRELSYIEGWHVISEANRIFGYGWWNRETTEMRLLGEPYQKPQLDRNGKPRIYDGQPVMLWYVNYAAKVRIKVTADDAVFVIREGYGFGSGIDRDIGQAHESALKEAETDAMKRALMTFGNQFGLALYDKQQREVADATRSAPAEVALSPDAPREMTVAAEARIESDLLAKINDAQTPIALTKVINHPDNIRSFSSLDQAAQDRVSDAIAARRSAMQRAA